MAQYRIIAGRVSKKSVERYQKSYTFRYFSEIFSSSDLQEAVDMWQRLCGEEYRPHMLFVADFGLMTGAQLLKSRLSGCSQTNDRYDAVVPYLEIAKFHCGEIVWNQDETHILDDKADYEYKDVLQSLYLYEKLSEKCDTLEMTRVEHFVNVSGRKAVKMRTVVSSDKIKDQKAFNVCPTIIQHEAYVDRARKLRDKDRKKIKASEEKDAKIAVAK